MNCSLSHHLDNGITPIALPCKVYFFIPCMLVLHEEVVVAMLDAAHVCEGLPPPRMLPKEIDFWN
jgi:hypothetical protein